MTQTKQELVVGYQGAEGAYSQLAAMHHFANDSDNVLVVQTAGKFKSCAALVCTA